MEYLKLNNGVMMPQIGYGVYQIAPDVCERHVAEALSVGYRMIDTAQAYHNEDGVGRAVADCGISRDEIFLVTKVWISNYGYDKAKASIEESLSRLRTDYIDLILLHQPFCDRYGAYRALQDAYRDSKPSGDACVLPTAEGASHHAGIWHPNHVMGTICRRSQQSFREYHTERDCRAT